MDSSAASENHPGEVPRSHKRALLLGVDRYGADIPPLRNAVRDVQVIGDVLRTAQGYDVRLLTDEQVTWSNLERELAAACIPAPPDRFVFYFAGHGITAEAEDGSQGPQGYLIPQDANTQDRNSFWPMKRVEACLREHLRDCKHVLVILDSCFAGAFRWSSYRNLQVHRPKLYRERFERYLRSPAWQVIASAAADEQAADWIAGKVLSGRGGPDTNSPFAAALREGLCGQAETSEQGRLFGDGVILATELHLFIAQRFADLERKHHRAVQTPLLWSVADSKGEFLFDVPGRTPQLERAAELQEQNNPYRGLKPYSAQHAGLFFGRAQAAQALNGVVQRSQVVLVSGASGTGKSSLVQAGVVPGLTTSGDSGSWKVLKVHRPESDALAMFGQWAQELQAPRPVSSPAGPDAAPLSAVLQSWCAANSQTQLLLVVDQLEEIITLGSPLWPFLDALRQAVRVSPQVHVILTLRSDFEPHFDELMKWEAPGVQRFLVPPLRVEEMREIIEGPAAERVLEFAPPKLVDTVINELKDTPAPLPLLSFVLSEMYLAACKRPEDRSLTEEDYQALGGVNGALSRRADSLYEEFKQDPQQEKSFRYLMLRMVVPGELARRRVLKSELSFSDPEENKRVQAITERLVAQRLVLADVDGQKREFIEPAHDKLVMGWPRLHQFLVDDKATHALHHSVMAAQQSWSQGGQLWSLDARRAVANKALREQSQRWNRVEREFIRKSQRLFYGLWGSGVSLLLIVLAVMSLWLVRERRAAEQLRKDKEEIRQSKEEIHQKLVNTYIDRGRALLFDRQRPSEALLWLHRAQVEGSTDSALPDLLHSALHSVGSPKAVLIGHGDSVDHAAWSPDGRRIVTASRDKTARVWDADSGRLLVKLEGHGENVAHAAWSPDGRRIVTGSGDKTARVWDADSGRLVVKLEGHENPILYAAWRPDGSRIVTVSQESTARVWDADSGRLVVALKGHAGNVGHAAYSPDGRRIVTASMDNTAREWDADSGRLRAVLRGHTEQVEQATYSPNGRQIVTASWDNTARVWSSETGQLAVVLKGHESFVQHAAWSPDGHQIVTASDDGTARVWSVESGRQIAKLGPPLCFVRLATWSPDGRRILTRCHDDYHDDEAKVWDAGSGRLMANVDGHSKGLYSASYSPDGRRVLTTSGDHTARVWQVESGSLLAKLEQPKGDVRQAAYSPDGLRLVTISSDDGAQVWDAVSGRRLAKLEGTVVHAAYSPDGRRIVTTNWWSHAIRVWDADGGRLLLKFEEQENGISRSAYSPDGRRILTSGPNTMPQVWDADSGRLLAKLDGHRDSVLHAAWSPDGRRIVTAGEDHTARVWDAGSGHLIRTLERSTSADEPPRVFYTDNGNPVTERHANNLSAPAWSPDGHRIVTAIENEPARVWDAETGRRLALLRGHTDSIVHTAWSPDGRRIVTASQDNTARVWDADSGRLLAKLEGHQNAVLHAAWSPDGRRIVTASEDTTAWVWDAAGGRLLAKLDGHKSSIASAAWSPDGRRIVTVGSADKAARVWDLSSDTPAPQQLADFIRCRNPLQFDTLSRDFVVANEPSAQSCANQLASP